MEEHKTPNTNLPRPPPPPPPKSGRPQITPEGITNPGVRRKLNY